MVISGGREPAHWEAYPNHQFISTVGSLACCAEGGCWKSRCQTVGDGDTKDHRDLCENPVQIRPDLRIPKCMDLITADDVIRRIELYFQGGALAYDVSRPLKATMIPKQRILIRFGHGLGDAVQFTVVLKHLRHFHPEWEIDLRSLHGKHSAFSGLSRRSFSDKGEQPSGPMSNATIWPGSKITMVTLTNLTPK